MYDYRTLISSGLFSDIIFSKRRSHLSTTLACFNNFNKTDSEKYEEMYDSNTKCNIENIDHQLSDL